FFFQAEDGIRDFHVTGVQTCALPISRERLQALARGESAPPAVGPVPVADAPDFTEAVARLIAERRTTIDWLATLDDAAWDENLRSEERRVGKECRAR